MTQPNWNQGNIPTTASPYQAGAGAANDFEAQTRGTVENKLRTQKKPMVDNAFGGFNDGLVGVLMRVFTGLGGGLVAGLQLLADLFLLRWDQADRNEQASQDAKSQAEGARTAAKQVDLRVDALFGGGTRTIYTSDATWSKPANLEKIVVIACGAGRKSGGPPPVGSPQPGAVGGGWIVQEFTADVVPDTVSITIGMPPTTEDQASQSRFGALLESAENAAGLLQSSTLLALDPGIRPGAAGQSGYGYRTTSSNGNGVDVRVLPQNGYSTALAAGGQAPSGAGANAPMTGQFLAGGGGGAGGTGSNTFFGPLSNGGAGGFPGGAGGPPGRSGNEAYCVPGIPAQGFVAVITYIRKTA